MKKKIDEKFLLPDDMEYLEATKTKVEKQALENKKGKVLENAFSFFFGAKKEEKKEGLTEEEKEIFEDIYKEENIINYIKWKNKY